MPVELIEIRRKELLKKFVGGMGKERVEDLVLVSRVVDYVVDELIIRKETFEKMSRDKLINNIRAKIDGLN